MQRVEVLRQGLEDFLNIMLQSPMTAGDDSLCAFLEIPPVAALHGLVSNAGLQVGFFAT